MFRGVRFIRGVFRGITGCPEGVPGVFQVVPEVLQSAPGCSGPVLGFTDTDKGGICILKLDEQIGKYSIGFKGAITWNKLPLRYKKHKLIY